MKSQQILNILFGLLVVCIQLHSLSANQEADNAVDADKERLREYLKAMSEYNSDHAMAVDQKKAYENNEEESSELNTEDNNDAENELDKRSAYLRFGKRSYLRFGRNPNLGFLRFGKRSPSSYLRFGKRSPAYLRFGRSVE